MSKGISLDEFKNQLDTDAQKRCLAQEKTIHEQNEQLRRKTEYIEKQSKMIKALQNRCKAITFGQICIFCDMKHECTAKSWKV